MSDHRGYDFTGLQVTFPANFVAHVEINRPKKYNAFSPEYVRIDARQRDVIS